MDHRRRKLLGAAITLLVPVLFGASGGRPLDIGQAAPNFEVTSVQGEAVSLAIAIRDHKAVVVLFTSTVCPYANYFASHVRDLSENYGPRGVLFLGVNSNNWESHQDVVDHIRERGVGFPMLKDQGHLIADQFGATRTPEAFLVDSTGRLRYRGWVKSKQESPDLQRAIEAVIDGRQVQRPVTKAFGCAVDRF